MIAELVAVGHETAHQRLVSADPLTDHEEGRPGIVLGQQAQKLGCGRRVRPIVDGQRHHRRLHLRKKQHARGTTSQERQQPARLREQQGDRREPGHERGRGRACGYAADQCPLHSSQTVPPSFFLKSPAAWRSPLLGSIRRLAIRSQVMSKVVSDRGPLGCCPRQLPEAQLADLHPDAAPSCIGPRTPGAVAARIGTR